MRLSELLAQLNALLAEHGDLEVFYITGGEAICFLQHPYAHVLDDSDIDRLVGPELKVGDGVILL